MLSSSSVHGCKMGLCHRLSVCQVPDAFRAQHMHTQPTQPGLAGAPMDSAADLSAAERALLIQPPGLASAKELLRIATTSEQQSAVPLPAGSVIGSSPSEPMGASRSKGQTGVNWGSKSFLLVWADTAEPVRLTPSVLLAHLILCSRRVRGVSCCLHSVNVHQLQATLVMQHATTLLASC